MARDQRPTSSHANVKLPEKTFVLDNGAHSIKAGFAPSQALPDTDILLSCKVIPNCLVRTRDRKTYIAAETTKITQWTEAVYRRPLEHGQIVSWEAQKEIWDHSFFDPKTSQSEIYIEDAASTTLLLTEAANTIPVLSKNADEVIMEEWGFGGYLRCIGAPLNAFNDTDKTFGTQKPTTSARECLLVIDCGHTSTTIIPCFEGKPIQRAIRRLDIGGRHLTNMLKEVISVRYFDLHQDTNIVNDIKEDISFVSQDMKVDLEKTWKGAKTKTKDADDMDTSDTTTKVDYVLPDGVNVIRGFSRPHDPSKAAEKRRKQALRQNDDNEVVMTLGNERFTVPEIMFNPSDIGSKQSGLAECVIQSLSKLPPLVHATMFANILCVGGSANIPGLTERLEADLRARVRTEWKVCVRKSSDPIKSTWLGCARFASNHRDTLQQRAVTREQYQEHGSNWAVRKFALST